MKVEELRIGNLVYGFKTVWCIDNTDFSSDQISTYDPIPVTEEWLVKLGFHKQPKEILGNKYFLLGFFIEIKDGIGIIYKEGKGLFNFIEIVHIKYIHQLQNIYFALTGKELKINE
jgi:hypothetical protein